MTAAYVAFGANLGEPAEVYRLVGQRLADFVGNQNVQASRLFQTAPVGGPAGQSVYSNGCFRIETSLPAVEFFRRCQEIETEFGRERTTRWGARTIDLDLVLFGSEIIDTPELTVPHPRMAYRRFVIAPLADVDPVAIHPIFRLTAVELLERIDAPDASLLLLGGSPSLTAAAESCWRTAFPTGRVVHCSEPEVSLTIIQGGGLVVASSWPLKDWRGMSPERTWIAIANLPGGNVSHATGGEAPLYPAADCRAPSESESSAAFATVVDALRA